MDHPDRNCNNHKRNNRNCDKSFESKDHHKQKGLRSVDVSVSVSSQGRSPGLTFEQSIDVNRWHAPSFAGIDNKSKGSEDNISLIRSVNKRDRAKNDDDDDDSTGGCDIPRQNQKSRKQNSKQNLNDSVSKYSYNKFWRDKYMNHLRYSIMAKIKNDIKSMKDQSAKSTEKYDPIPICMISSITLQVYINFRNIIILKNPQIETKPNDNVKCICYDSEPLYIGSNLKNMRR